jgi:NhaP-type Na+/H+ or K+/H+ antiporter
VGEFSDFAAAFYVARDDTPNPVHAAEGVGETLALLAWCLFGIAVVGDVLHQATWEVVAFALLSLTLTRMLPNYLALVGTGEPVSSRLSLGWFRPRGLASIVLQEGVPGAEPIAHVVACTVVFSLVLHGITANPLANWIAGSVRRSSS